VVGAGSVDAALWRLSPLPSRAASFFWSPSANVSVAAVQQLLGCSLQLLTGAVTAVQHCLLRC
jgi:hypothetical protein